MLVALLLLLVFTLRTTVVSIFSSMSCPLVVVISMVFINNPGVMSNNTRMVITRLLFFMAIGLVHNTGKGYAFVTFEEKDAAENAIREMDGQTLNGQQIKVNEAKPREGGGRGGGRGRGGFGGGRGGRGRGGFGGGYGGGRG